MKYIIKQAWHRFLNLLLIGLLLFSTQPMTSYAQESDNISETGEVVQIDDSDNADYPGETEEINELDDSEGMGKTEEINEPDDSEDGREMTDENDEDIDDETESIVEDITETDNFLNADDAENVIPNQIRRTNIPRQEMKQTAKIQMASAITKIAIILAIQILSGIQEMSNLLRAL